MPKKLRLKFFTIVAVPLICVLGIIGLPGTFNQLKENLRERIRLGLDLRGGMHLILQVNTEDALNIETDLLVERIKRALEDEEISFEDIRRRDITHVEILDVESTKVRDVRALITESYSAWDIVNLFNPPNSFLLTLRPTVVSQIRESSVREAIQRIRNRVDELGVTEPVIPVSCTHLRARET